MNAFVCFTPIQIVRAIYMKYAMQEFDEPADLYIIPTFANAQLVGENIKGIGTFNNVYQIDLAGLNRAVSARLMYGCNKLAKQIKNSNYQKVIAFNIESPFINALYNRNKYNEGFEYHYVEDAPGMYKMYAPSEFTPLSLNGLLKIEHPYYNTHQWWFSNPDFMEIPGIESPNVKKLLPIDINDDVFVDLINKIFQFSPDEILNEADILIMEESFYTDGMMLDNYDYVLFEEIRKHFPKRKFAVKLHPRTKVNRFEKDFQNMSGSWIPWEIYVMNGLRKKQHFPIQMGIACNTLTSDKFMFDAESSKIVLAPLFQDKLKRHADGSSNADKKIIKKFAALRETYAKPEQMAIAYSKDILFDTLTKWLDQ